MIKEKNSELIASILCREALIFLSQMKPDLVGVDEEFNMMDGNGYRYDLEVQLTNEQLNMPVQSFCDLYLKGYVKTLVEKINESSCELCVYKPTYPFINDNNRSTTIILTVSTPYYLTEVGVAIMRYNGLHLRCIIKYDTLQLLVVCRKKGDLVAPVRISL